MGSELRSLRKGLKDEEVYIYKNFNQRNSGLKVNIRVHENVLLFIVVLLYSIVSFAGAQQDNDNFSRKVEMNNILNSIAREIGNSQILSLNLTNIIIWLVLKGLLFGAAYVNSGSWKGHRSLDEAAGEIFQSKESIIDEKEILLFLGYAMGEKTENFDCLKKIACIEPKKAKQYAAAARMLINGAKFVSSPVNPKYEKLIGDIKYAIQLGKTGGNCDKQYFCSTNNEID
ncbi:hypothetical protein LSTR_LSTR006065 [Laodelphax striatellus]|uniref:Uncharacterized protein n=1 Tax=Laodelphax striatellus TaxID=195883 RepID=A0A482XSA0_LAOST|nr:hypothetical protein LSTR_LSTR006065 [Laodelphax striatellus]